MPRPIAVDPDQFLDPSRLVPISREEGKAAWEQAYAALEMALAEAGADAELFVVFGIQAGGKSTWVRSALRTARDNTIFFSGPLPSRKHRERVLGIARRAGCRVTGVWVRLPLSEALQRNASRRGLACVPEGVIRHVDESLEPPSLEEGFHHILVVEGAVADA